MPKVPLYPLGDFKRAPREPFIDKGLLQGESRGLSSFAGGLDSLAEEVSGFAKEKRNVAEAAELAELLAGTEVGLAEIEQNMARVPSEVRGETRLLEVDNLGRSLLESASSDRVRALYQDQFLKTRARAAANSVREDTQNFILDQRGRIEVSLDTMKDAAVLSNERDLEEHISGIRSTLQNGVDNSVYTPKEAAILEHKLISEIDEGRMRELIIADPVHSARAIELSNTLSPDAKIRLRQFRRAEVSSQLTELKRIENREKKELEEQSQGILLDLMVGMGTDPAGMRRRLMRPAVRRAMLPQDLVTAETSLKRAESLVRAPESTDQRVWAELLNEIARVRSADDIPLAQSKIIEAMDRLKAEDFQELMRRSIARANAIRSAVQTDRSQQVDESRDFLVNIFQKGGTLSPLNPKGGLVAIVENIFNLRMRDPKNQGVSPHAITLDIIEEYTRPLLRTNKKIQGMLKSLPLDSQEEIVSAWEQGLLNDDEAQMLLTLMELGIAPIHRRRSAVAQ